MKIKSDNIKIRFIDKKTGKYAKPFLQDENDEDEDSKGFYLGADGKVYEFVEQWYANYAGMHERDDLIAIIEEKNKENEK